MRDFVFHIADDRYAIPTLEFVSVLTEARAHELAIKRLNDSNHHLGIEVFEDEATLFRIERGGWASFAPFARSAAMLSARECRARAAAATMRADSLPESKLRDQFEGVAREWAGLAVTAAVQEALETDLIARMAGD